MLGFQLTRPGRFLGLAGSDFSFVSRAGPVFRLDHICIAQNEKSRDTLLRQENRQAFKCLSDVATVDDAIRRAAGREFRTILL